MTDTELLRKVLYDYAHYVKLVDYSFDAMRLHKEGLHINTSNALIDALSKYIGDEDE